MNSKNQLNKCKKSIKNSIKKFKKTDISMPCLFNHVTNLDINDSDKFYSLSTLVVRALNQKTAEDQQYTDNHLTSNLTKLSIDNQLIENLATNCASTNKQQIYKQYISSSLCSYSSSSSPISPGSSCSYTSEDHS